MWQLYEIDRFLENYNSSELTWGKQKVGIYIYEITLSGTFPKR